MKDADSAAMTLANGAARNETAALRFAADATMIVAAKPTRSKSIGWALASFKGRADRRGLNQI
jgi:hypothetical protein